ncbi:43888_t:CDS:2 [Gigaspora margarita]|uniref:43888_t:CDS:1 n=1 Tax=Gigaspora margarita TaxID=4874 RepID=A0ABN7V5E7_GIGMA|nr:43888_t:CDS:2 [Gigaspora margarita]
MTTTNNATNMINGTHILKSQLSEVTKQAYATYTLQLTVQQEILFDYDLKNITIYCKLEDLPNQPNILNLSNTNDSSSVSEDENIPSVGQ